MNKKFITFLILLLLTSQSHLMSQSYQLMEIVDIARTKSPVWLQAETRRETRHWQFRTFQSNYNPQLRMEGNLPNYQRRFTPVTQPDGNIEYRSVSNNNSDLSLRLIQNISATGATVFINSSVARFDDFNNDFTTFNIVPVSIGLVQPIFRFNNLLWDKKIEPLRYLESQKEYFEELESISIEATSRFFDLMLAQVNLEMAQKNLANNDTIYKIAEGRYQLGKIGENDLLQLRANYINSELDVAQARLDLETANLSIKSFAGLTIQENIQLILPDNLPDFEVDEEKALFEANKNGPDPISFRRRLLEGNREVAQAQGDNGVNLDLVATYGLNNSGENLPSTTETQMINKL